jgi:hypothetical protein
MNDSEREENHYVFYIYGSSYKFIPKVNYTNKERGKYNNLKARSPFIYVRICQGHKFFPDRPYMHISSSLLTSFSKISGELHTSCTL